MGFEDHLVNGDEVYRFKDVIYINDAIVSVDDLADMSYDELIEIHESLMEFMESNRAAPHIHRMLTAVNGEFARRSYNNAKSYEN